MKFYNLDQTKSIQSMYRLASQAKSSQAKSARKHKSKISLGPIRPQSNHEVFRENRFDTYAKLIRTDPSILHYIDACNHHKLFDKQQSDFFTTDTLECIDNTIMYAQDFEKYFGHVKLYKSAHKINECYASQVNPARGDYKNTGCNICETYTWEYNSLENSVIISDLLERNEGFSVEHLFVNGSNKRIVIHPNFCADACCG